MTQKNSFLTIQEEVIETLLHSTSEKELWKEESFFYITQLPSINKLKELIELLTTLFFPTYFLKGNKQMQKQLLQIKTQHLYTLLTEQIQSALHSYTYQQQFPQNSSPPSFQYAANLATSFITKLPFLQDTLMTDVQAIYKNDPAVNSYEEVILCYPSIKALLHYRVANALLSLQIPLIPRMLTELAHSETGIDIHPAAKIGHHFSIDHGTGVVIGATCIIGNYVKIYQGVTLGAKSFPIDKEGNLIKDIPRHPILEDNVIIYSNSTILGRITIGRNSIIGGNLWVTESVPAYTKLTQAEKKKD